MRRVKDLIWRRERVRRAEDEGGENVVILRISGLDIVTVSFKVGADEAAVSSTMKLAIKQTSRSPIRPASRLY